MADINSLLHQIDLAVTDLKQQQWTASLPFHGLLCLAPQVVPIAPLSSYQDHHDLFSLTHCTNRGLILRFDPNTFPVPPAANLKDSFKKLFDALITASHLHGGCQLVSNGSTCSGKKILKCSNFQIYRPNKSKKKVEGQLRKSTFVGDRKNSRGPAGQSLPKRTRTIRPMTLAYTCKAKLTFDADSHSLFLVCGIGHDQHQGHLRRCSTDMATRKRIVPTEAADFQMKAANKNIGPGKTAAMVNDEFGLHLSRRQVAQMQEMAKLADDLKLTKELEQFKSASSNTDRLLAYLRKKGATYCALYHGVGGSLAELGPRAQKQATAEVGLRDVDSRHFVWTEKLDYAGKDSQIQLEVLGDEKVFSDDLVKYGSDRRRAVSATDDQHVLLALVWSMPEGKRCFQAFPELVFCDGTHKTNKENRPLITFGVKDADGNVQVVVRAWAPNERAWMFRWLFQTAVPAIIGKGVCERIKLVLTDGDSQELTQLDAALESVFTRSLRRRCGWHIVQQGWKYHIGSLGRSKDAKAVSQIIKNWLYSFMKSVETLSEYKASKALLFAYLKSDRVRQVIGDTTLDSIVTFVRSHVLVHEHHFARCYYLDVRGFEGYSNTCLEGTNYGVKYCELAVLPNMSQAAATKVMINQDEVKAAGNKKKISDAFHKTALHTSVKSSGHLLQTATSMLQLEMDAAEGYASYRVDEKKWIVQYSGYRDLEHKILPVFRRLRSVTIDDKDRMKCSCCLYERNGIPCRHICHVALKFCPDFDGFTHHSVDLRYWTVYSMYMVARSPHKMTSEELKIRQSLGTARLQDSQLPSPGVPFVAIEEKRYAFGSNSLDKYQSMTENEVIRLFMEVLPIHNSILNYKPEIVQKSMSEMDFHQGHATGMTQETHNCSDDESISFPFAGEGDLVDEQPSVGAHEFLTPLWKELVQLYDGADRQELQRLGSMLEREIISRKEELVAGQIPSTGQVVSCMVPNNARKRKHTRQPKY